MELSLLDLWSQMGGFAKGIVVVLAIMSVWSLSITIKKWWDLRKAQAETRKFAPEFSQFLEEDNLTEAIKLAEKLQEVARRPRARRRADEIKPLIQDGSVTVADINSAERAVEREMLMTITDLKRGLGVLATVGATAPFVGLLGTTMGIVNAFVGMAASGSGGLSAISAGVAEALITTAFGLLVAIPGGVGVQLLPDEDRQPHGRDDVHVEGNDRLPDQGRVRRVRPLALHPRVQHHGLVGQRPDLAVTAEEEMLTMAMSTGGGGEVKAEPNVTPMIDVMLVLLIIFMVVVPAISAGFQAIPPQGINLKPHPEEERDQVLGIDANGQYYLNKKPIPNAELGQAAQGDLREPRQRTSSCTSRRTRTSSTARSSTRSTSRRRTASRVTGMITDQKPGTVSLVQTDRIMRSAGEGGKPSNGNVRRTAAAASRTRSTSRR